MKTLVLMLIAINVSACTQTRENVLPSNVHGSIPEPQPPILTGSQFVEMTTGMPAFEREQVILNELSKGNIPPFLRELEEIKIQQTLSTGKSVEATFWVTVDYLAIGPKSDFIRIPMNPITAQRIADHYGYILPTRKLVDAIYSASKTKLEPKPLKPGPHMVSSAQYEVHHQIIQNQLADKCCSSLIAGHKKDVVISNKLNNKSAKVAIYGWHRSTQDPIQPLSTVHGNHYADYSHGVRLISRMMKVNHEYIAVSEVLSDPILSEIVSDEGPFINTRYQTVNSGLRKYRR